MSRALLQICTAVLALVPISTGIISMRGVRDPLYRPLHLPEVPVLDSNLRFFGGVWLGLGLALLWTVPAIEQHGTLSRPFIGFTLLEIVGAPFFIYWQSWVAQSALAP
jgi:hypothetical protein